MSKQLEVNVLIQVLVVMVFGLHFKKNIFIMVNYIERKIHHLNHF